MQKKQYLRNLLNAFFSGQSKKEAELEKRKDMTIQKDDQELYVHEMNVENGALNMKLGGEPAKFFMMMLIGFFEENGGENFLTTTVENQAKRYEITIRNLNGQDSPAEKVARIQKENDELHAVLAKLQTYLDFSKPVESSLDLEDSIGVNRTFKQAHDLLVKLNHHN